jgi:pyridoxine 5-phosphate synthase
MGALLRIRLGVNVDHVATVRQARCGRIPDPMEAALACQRAQADSIVCHLREDRRHIQDEDVRSLRRALKIPLNLEMSIAPSVVSAALAAQPHQVTLVPERRQELTTEGGLDVAGQRKRLEPIIANFLKKGIAVSLFVDPDRKQVMASHELGAPIIELHTGAFADAKGSKQRLQALKALKQAAALAAGQGLRVAAGHGLDYDNVGAIARIHQIEEVNIGFSIISYALEVGMESAVRRMRYCLGQTPGRT